MSTRDELRFPCTDLPAEPGRQRLLGVYGMRRDSLLMQRVKIHAGRMNPAQLGAAAEIARKCTPDYPLHFTTRQDIEFHGVKPVDIPAVQQALARVELTTVGACGDAVRNVTTCPGNGLCKGSCDVHGAAAAIRRCAESLPFTLSMPRKFKISLSGCAAACARPWINDLGLIAQDDGTWRAIVAGSLGSRPATGIEWPEPITPDRTVHFVAAALRLFNELGDRENRGRARFRHVRERLGDDSFCLLLAEQFRKEVASADWPDAPPGPKGDGSRVSVRLQLPLGDLEPEAALELADAADEADASIAVALEHGLILYSDRQVRLGQKLLQLAGRKASIVCCPGSTWCLRGIVSSRDAGDVIREALPADCDLNVAVSGCPNNCSHAAVADIGLVGRLKKMPVTEGGEKQPRPCYRFLAGGDKGAGPELALELHPAVPAERVGDATVMLWADFQQNRSDGERLGEFVRRNETRLARLIGVLAEQDR